MTDGLTETQRAGIRAVLASSPKVSRVMLFGSRALGTFRPSSDVDLALEGENLCLDDLLQLNARIAELNLPVDVDFAIRAAIKNPALENHIREYGCEWYRRPTPAPAHGA